LKKHSTVFINKNQILDMNSTSNDTTGLQIGYDDWIPTERIVYLESVRNYTIIYTNYRKQFAPFKYQVAGGCPQQWHSIVGRPPSLNSVFLTPKNQCSASS
jgi:outer membrane receptor for Fe3+-dicitrate